MYKILHIPTGEYLYTINKSGVFWIGKPQDYINTTNYFGIKKQAEKAMKNACSNLCLLYEIDYSDLNVWGFPRSKQVKKCGINEFETIEVPDV